MADALFALSPKTVLQDTFKTIGVTTATERPPGITLVPSRLPLVYKVTWGQPVILRGGIGLAQQLSEALVTWRVEADPQGNLWFTLSLAGVMAWLQQLNQWQATAVYRGEGAIPPTQSPFLTPRNWNLPLCDRVGLSLPAFVQYSYGRCGSWLVQADGAKWLALEPGTHSSRPIVSAPPVWKQSIENPSVGLGATHLIALVQALDTLARHSTPPTYWRQGYCLGASLYDLLSQWRPYGQGPEGDDSEGDRLRVLWVIRATQVLLGHILHVLGQPPVERI
ncbi:hypothetical protein [Leptolyngbya sp. PCC 6406]|uniref:hypothetical protein n=1 Tax=Leptolyngbya sp. PCC 6406 TaxID=1173264 RepID=UPI0002AC13D3|nr:hypothetical protein [Leptolyngbya sp. PCC 6406]